MDVPAESEAKLGSTCSHQSPRSLWKRRGVSVLSPVSHDALCECPRVEDYQALC